MKYIKYRNPQNTNFTNIRKYELWNLYIIQNTFCFFEDFPNFYNRFPQTKVFWHCWPILKNELLF